MRHRLSLLSIIIGGLLVLLTLGAVRAQAGAHEQSSTGSPESIEVFDSAYIAIQFSENNNAVRRISFDEPISGLEALLLTGMEVITANMGGTVVCSINGIGCPAENCFTCDGTKFWNYYSWDGETWIPSSQSASETEVFNGNIEGWRWGEWEQGELPPAPQLVAAADALVWLKEQQNTVTGGYSSMSSSVEVLLSIGANNISADEWRQKSYTEPLNQYIINNSANYASKTVAEAGKLSVGISASQLCWPPVTSDPKLYIDPENGTFSEHTGFNAWGVLGSLALSQTVPVGAIDQFTNSVLPNGAWEWNQGFGSDSNTTALVIQTLIASGIPTNSLLITNALDYLKYAQNPDGGFPYDPDSPYGTDSDANSTAYAIQAIQAVGQSPISGTWVINATNPISYLLSLQLENSSFEWMAGEGANLIATAQAIPALLGESAPYATRVVEGCPAIYLPITHRASDN